MEIDDTSGDANNNKVKYKLLIIIIFLLFLFSGAAAGVLYFSQRNNSLIPQQIQETIDFPIYLPKENKDIKIVKDSIRKESDILFYEVNYSNKIIYISLQKAPKNKPDFSKLAEELKFKKIDLPQGEGIAGVERDKPRVIFLNNTTLINMNSDSQTPIDLLLEVLELLKVV